MEERIGVFVSILAFLMVMGVLSGIGQRGLVFLAADLDFLFPAPIARRHLLVYHFMPHYLAAAFMGLLYLLVLGGRFMPHPLLFLLGVTLCQMTNAHLSALAAELSMALADRLYRRLRHVTTALVVLLTLAGMLVVIGGISGTGNVTSLLREGLESPVAQVIFFPAVQAVKLGAHPHEPARWAAFGSLALCALGSFSLVLALRVDFVEASFGATKKAWKKVDDMRRGVSKTNVKRSSAGPRGTFFQGAGAVLWLNALTMRRQLRTILGGLLVVMVMLAVFSGQRGDSGLAATLLFVLVMVPLWMPLPVGFRLPREQLLELRQLPLAPGRLAAALLAVPVLVPFLLQALATLILIVIGDLDVALALAVLPAFAAVGATMVAIESFFVLRRPHPNSINLLHSVAQLLLQLVALAPALISAAGLKLMDVPLPLIVLVAALVQAAVSYALLRVLGRRLQTGDVAVA